MNATLLALIMKYSLIYNVDPFLALAVAKVESNYNQQAIGSLGEVGVFQVRPEFYPTVDLHILKNNVRIGVKHLAKALKECKHKEDYTGVLCYNLGSAAASRIKHPKLFPYYKKVSRFYNESR